MTVSIDLNGNASGVNAQGSVAIGTPVNVFPPNTINITSTSDRLNRVTVNINSLLGPLLFSENLNVTAASGISASYNSVSGTLTLTATGLAGTASVSAFKQALESLQYNTQPLVPFLTPINARSFTVAGYETALSVLPEATASVTLNVTNNPSPLPVNTPPVAVPDAATTTAGNAVTTTNVLSNDTDLNGDALTVSSFTQAANGTVVNNNNGTFTYTPAAGFSGADSFTYTANDGKGGTSVGTVAVTVTPVVTPPVNTPPVAVPDAATTTSGSAVTTGNVLTNDTDLNGDALTVSSFTQATNGTVVNNNNGTFTYTPAAGFSGADSFTYTANDGKGGTSVGTVAVTVTPVVTPPVNIPPVAVPDAATTTSGNAVTTVNVLTNDTDLNGDALTVSSFTQATNGTVVNNNNGTFTYTPAAGFSGADSFTYTANDGKGGTSVGTVAVTVTPVVTPPVNIPPVAVPDAATTTSGNAVTTVNVLTNDTDLNGDALTVSSFTQATNGTVVNNNNGTFTYTPAAGFSGADSFTYTANDGKGGTSVGTVAVTVTPVVTPPVNTPPVAVPDAATTTSGSAVTTVNVLTNDTDLNGDALTVSSFTQATNGTVVNNNNGTFTYTPAAGFSGADSFTYTANDGKGGTSVGTVAVTVNPVNNNTNVFTGTNGSDTATATPVKDEFDMAGGDDTVLAVFDTLKQQDSIDGGSGSNTFVLTGGTATDSITLRSATASDVNNLVIGTGLAGTVIKNFQNFALRGFVGRVTLTGNDLANTLIGGSGNDSITGGAGNDILTGNGGNDVLDGGTGNDVLNGGAGNDRYFVNGAGDRIIDSAGIDTVTASINRILQSGLESLTLSGRATAGTGNSLNNVITGNNVRNTLVGNGGNDRLLGNGGDDLLRGGVGRDRLSGGAGRDRLLGDNGNDILSSDAGNDILLGGGGNDTLNGGLGNDRLTSGAGKDRLIGGAGRDSFIFDNVRTGSIDVIADFRSVDDTILVSRRGFSQNLQVGSLSASQFVLGSSAQDQGDRFLYDQRTGGLFFDVDGVGGASQVRIATLSNKTAITAADIAIVA
ncbi:tandem-95 repeat protein [Leptolyngbya sp. FACHB-671]|uniref:beta strand repeat-containing protein n=1 Tax=Leptolyngbya sp. FACHB-671 TaxID=2692812 RepID=UPI001682B942|nr:Ig-like domain-containing protein [Leptolyngbya sp. FACHB-671]MBD2068139.1 tandem-95 repeat protein [Leptolyngbya sp. FACHB-671]